MACIGHLLQELCLASSSYREQNHTIQFFILMYPLERTFFSTMKMAHSIFIALFFFFFLIGIRHKVLEVTGCIHSQCLDSCSGIQSFTFLNVKQYVDLF